MRREAQAGDLLMKAGWLFVALALMTIMFVFVAKALGLFGDFGCKVAEMIHNAVGEEGVKAKIINTLVDWLSGC